MAQKARIKPNSIEAEQSVLGCMLTDASCSIAGLESLDRDSFYEPRNAEIFSAMQELFREGKAIDFVTVTELLEKKGKMSEGGTEYIAELTTIMPSVANFGFYRDILTDKALKRAVIDVGTRMIEDAYEESSEATSILDRAGDSIYKTAGTEADKKLTHISDAIRESDELHKKVLESPDGLLGIPTGFPDLDRTLAGLQGSQMIVIAGRPGMGKTSFALNIADYVACTKKIPVLMFSLEMPAPQIASRMQCSRARVNAQTYRRGKFNSEETEKLKTAASELSESPLYIFSGGGITVTEMLAKARNLKAKSGLGLIVIDYMQLMTSGQRSDSRQVEVSQISRSIKIMANELDIPVITLSQLSRAGSQRDKNSKRPVLTDLRESGAIEQDADVVIFIHRVPYYEEMPSIEDQTKAEIIIAKQRNGATKTIPAAFYGEYTRFEEVDTVHAEDVFN